MHWLGDACKDGTIMVALVIDWAFGELVGMRLELQVAYDHDDLPVWHQRLFTCTDPVDGIGR